MNASGAGRPHQYGELKETLSLRVSPTLRAYVEAEAANSGYLSLSVTVEEIIRDSRKFNEWEKINKTTKKNENDLE